jgi:Regulator of chromosome condensation (RCC1) repeat
MRRTTRTLLAGLTSTLALVACGAAMQPIARVPFEALRCPDSGMACNFVEGGGIGCCARAADGTAATFMCPPNLGGRSVSQPRPVAGLIGAVHIEPLGGSLCARLGDGTVRCFGSNDRGALGLGQYRAMGGITAIGLQEMWGSDRGELEIGAHRCARAPDGTVRCWRAEEPPPSVPSCRPVAHDGAVYPSCEDPDADALCQGTAIALPVLGIDAATALFGRCVLQRGELMCWGDNSHGELRAGSTYGIPVATPVTGFAGPIASVDGLCAVLAKDGRVTCWGDAAQSLANNLVGVEQLALVSRFGGAGCALIYGRVHCWGEEVVRVAGLDRATQIGAASEAACALLEDETVACWGRNHHGQLGDGSTEDRERPVPVQGLSDVKQIQVGLFRACALLADGGVACWGSLPTDDGYADHPSPVRVEGLPPAVRVALAGNTLCAIAESTEVYCWGNVYAPVDPVIRDAAASPSVAGRTRAPGSIAEDVTPRSPPTGVTTSSCSTQSPYCMGTQCFASEDDCLDQRAMSKPPRVSCERLETTYVSSLGANGGPQICACRGDQCRRCRASGELFEQCSESVADRPCGTPDWETGEPVPDAKLAKHCETTTVAFEAPASKTPARYCGTGAIPLPRSCPPPPPNAGPNYCPPAWLEQERCFRSRDDCEAFRLAGVAHLPKTAAERCIGIAPR